MSGSSSSSAGILKRNTGAANVGTASGDDLETVLATLATTAEVNAAIANLVDSSPAALDTLNELAAALGDDANFATTMTNALAGKEATQSAASQTEAEAGTESAIRSFSPLRIAQAIAALVESSEWSYINAGTVSAEATADVTLSGSYDEYRLRLVSAIPATDNALPQLLTSSNGSTFDTGASDYEGSYILRSSATNSYSYQDAQIKLNITGQGVGNDTNENGLNATIDIINPGESKYTDIAYTFDYDPSDTQYGNYVGQGTGKRKSAGVVQTVRFKFNTGNITSAKWALYGRNRS